MRHISTFTNFLFEGGNALKSARPIKQSEVQQTLDSIRDVVFPALGISDWGSDALLIGSAGKKESDDATSGDLDIGIPMSEFCEKHGVDQSMGLKYVYDILRRTFPEFELVWMRGIEVVSLSYPIRGNPSNGYVQVDFLPLKDMEWAKFIYHSPDYRKGESQYKSAHRNWLFAAILSVLTEDEQYDGDGNLIGFSGYMMRLNDGLSKVRKSFVGKTKLLKNPISIKDDEQLITRTPADFIEFVCGPGYKPKDVATFESLYHIISGPDYKWSDKLSEIKTTCIKFLNRVKLQIPDELKKK